jgi:hypothetical protein
VSKVLSPERNHNNLVTATVEIRTVVTMTANTVDREGLQTNPQQRKPEKGEEERRDRK